MSTAVGDPSAATQARRGRWVRRHWRIVGGAGVVALGLIAFAVYWFDPQAVLSNRTIDEPFPGAAVVSASTPPAAAGAANAPLATPAAASTVSHGSFRSLEHGTTGTALILRLPDGSTVVRLEGLNTSDGPDVHVTLSPAPATAGDRDFGDYLDLGSLKANHGNQNYAVPAGTDLSRFHSIVIWCRRFSVGFGVAPIA